MRTGCQSPPKIAIVTGCSRGIGQAVASLLEKDGFIVIGAQRSIPTVENASNPKSNVRNVFLDLRCERSVQGFSQRMNDELPYLNLLVNNAGIDTTYPSEERAAEHWRSVMRVNFFGTVSITERLLPLLQKCPAKARVVNVSSGDGELLYFSGRVRNSLEALTSQTSLNEVKEGIEKILEECIGQSSRTRNGDMIFGDQPAYKLSKAALNVYTRVASRIQKAPTNEQVDFVAVCPGDVDTQMADSNVPLISPSDAAQNMRPILDLSNSGVNGFFFRHGTKISW